eukprot:TRINITY_DN41838_c0_g1_i1.p1 TRINITY_DN41838_c0_g1~~TRINITY_DN41838_c0_g1_i1.p1  ORF type:complete len:665 (-),score=139.50 TRINITY_DN41838_c0_g1_i1:103-2097(-)
MCRHSLTTPYCSVLAAEVAMRLLTAWLFLTLGRVGDAVQSSVNLHGAHVSLGGESQDLPGKLLQHLRHGPSRVGRSRTQRAGAEACSVLQNQGSYFTIKLGVGTPAQHFDVVADTGSDSVVVTSCVCTQDFQACDSDSHCFRGTNVSSSFSVLRAPKKSGQKVGDLRMVQLAFGSGPVSTVIASDVVNVGGLDAKMNGSLLLMVDQALDIDGGFDGILGLGMPARVMQKTLSDAALGKHSYFNPKGFLETAGISKFSICAQDGGDGVLRMGSLLEGEALGSVGEAHWGLNFHGVSIGGQELPAKFCNDGKGEGSGACAAIPDSGTTLMMAPPEHLMTLYASLCDSWTRCTEFYEKTKDTQEDADRNTDAGTIINNGTSDTKVETIHMMRQARASMLRQRRPPSSGDQAGIDIEDILGSNDSLGGSGQGWYSVGAAGIEYAKADAFQSLLYNCAEWAPRGKDESGVLVNGTRTADLSEMPDIFLHVSGKRKERKALKLPANFYVVETEEEEVKHVIKHLLGVFPVEVSVPTGKKKKVCMPAFASQMYEMKEGTALWILGTPVFYRYVVGYDMSSQPPSMFFNGGDCTGCESTAQSAAPRSFVKTGSTVVAAPDGGVVDVSQRHPAGGSLTERRATADVVAGRKRSRPLQVRGPLRVKQLSPGFRL